VTNRPCPGTTNDCCIHLANIHIPAPDQESAAATVDITVRPIVYTNDILYELLLASMGQGQAQPRGGKS
jgi:hypothetical protein